MRALLASMCLVLSCGVAAAQPTSKGDLGEPTGRSAPEAKGRLQPQGWTGPIDTGSGGAPPESPRGQSAGHAAGAGRIDKNDGRTSQIAAWCCESIHVGLSLSQPRRPEHRAEANRRCCPR